MYDCSTYCLGPGCDLWTCCHQESIALAAAIAAKEPPANPECYTVQ
ncbi:hypothetical protein [Thermosinus carboxydivorans]|nr:hypothetical protein [Thermosinus carboxydivorans]